MIPIKDGRFKSFDDVEIYYELRGEGPPVVCCYGIGCLFNHFHEQVQFFSNQYQTLMFDYRGHQQSSSPEDPAEMTIENIAQDLIGLLDHLGIEKASFVGHSFGGQVLIETYRKRPDLFSNIVFINGFVDNPIRDMFGSDIPSQLFDVLKGSHDLLPKTVDFLFKKTVGNPIAAPISAFLGGFNLNLTAYKDIEIYTKALSGMDLDAFLALFEKMMKYDGKPYLSEIEVPCLVIAGLQDAVTPLHHQKLLAESLKHGELAEIPYGSHCTHLDLPEYVNLRIDKFYHATGFADTRAR